MHKLQLFVFLISNIIVLASCQSCADSTTNSTYCDCQDAINCTDFMKRAEDAVSKFAFQYVYQLLVSKCDTIITAPLALYYFLIMFGIYTKPNTEAYYEMLNFTQMKNEKEVRCILPKINSLYDNQPDATTYFSDNIISGCRNTYSKQFVCDASVILEGRALNYNFQYPGNVLGSVNKVIAVDTGNYVQNAIPSSSIFKANCTASKTVLASGRYFAPKFKKPFVPVGKRNYTDMDNNTSQVNFVMQCGTFNYSDSDILNAKIIQFYLKYDFLLYTMIVPNDGCTLIELTKTLQDTAKFNQAMNSLQATSIKLILPQLSSGTSTTNNVDVLRKEGLVSSYFNSETANIVDENGEPRNTYLANGISTVYIKNTGYQLQSSDDECTDGIMEFVIDRPLLYFTSVRGSVINLCGIGKVITN